MNASPYVVALTGGIASGKSAVADAFRNLGVMIVDADVVARDVVSPGSEALAEVVDAFGPTILDINGSLDRRRMRERIFADEAARHRLESLLHPRIRREMRARAASAPGPYVLVVVPLLAEGGRYPWVDRVLVVDVERETQLTRLLARDGITPDLARRMLDAQASRAERLAIADDVIENDGTLADLGRAVALLHAAYGALAESRD